MAPLAQLVEHARAAVPRLVLDVDGANLGEHALARFLALRWHRATPGLIRASRDADGLAQRRDRDAAFPQSTSSCWLMSGPREDGDGVFWDVALLLQLRGGRCVPTDAGCERAFLLAAGTVRRWFRHLYPHG